MRRNYWKISFWVLLCVFIISTSLLLFTLIDQGVTHTYQSDGYKKTESDLLTITNLYIDNCFKKECVKEHLKSHPDFESMSFTSDTIELNRYCLIFRADTLYQIKASW